MIHGFPDLDPDRCRAALATGDVLVFSVPVDLITQPENVSKYLDPTEHARWLRFRQPADADAFLAGRSLLRECLALFLGGCPIDISLTEQGKPFCLHPQAPHFNLSHGGGWLTLAFCQQVSVGVDVESLQREFSYQALAQRYFSDVEKMKVAADGKSAFIKIWTMKEARLKASGEGLRVELSEVDLESEDWNFHSFNPIPSVLATLAYPGMAREVRHGVAPL